MILAFLEVNGESIWLTYFMENSNPPHEQEQLLMQKQMAFLFSVIWLERNLLCPGQTLLESCKGLSSGKCILRIFFGLLSVYTPINEVLGYHLFADMPSRINIVITAVKIANTTWAAIL